MGILDSRDKSHLTQKAIDEAGLRIDGKVGGIDIVKLSYMGYRILREKGYTPLEIKRFRKRAYTLEPKWRRLVRKWSRGGCQVRMK